MISAIILAAGESRRMGKPKAMLEFPDGETLLAKQVNLLATAPIPSLCKGGMGRVVQISTPPNLPLQRGGIGNISIVVVLGHEAERIKKMHPDLPVSWCINEQWKKGQFSSIQAGIISLLQSEVTAIIVLPVDAVGIHPDTIKTIIDVVNKQPNFAAVIPEYKGQKGHPVLLQRSFAEGLLEIDPNNATARLDMQIDKASNVIRLPVNDPKIVGNINTPEGWENYLASIVSKR